MPIREFTAENFRCLRSAELEFESRFNLIYGANAAGKTSILEALGYLGRGRSFRGAAPATLIRHGCKEFVLFGRVRSGARFSRIGVRNGSGGLEVRIDGETAGGAAALAEALPLQVIDPEVHELVAGGPEERRRYLDWIAFHVEQGYLPLWRRFRRALRQRNAALKAGASTEELLGWTAEFAQLAEEIDAARQRAVQRVSEGLRTNSEALLGVGVGFEYRRGWDTGPLAEALEASLSRDREIGSTQLGPQRAELRVCHDERLARKLVSRGQQKLLAAAMVLAATEVAQRALETPLLLLLDDPAAELDGDSLRRFMSLVIGLDCQVVATSLVADALEFPQPPAVFHVEQGTVRRIP